MISKIDRVPRKQKDGRKQLLTIDKSNVNTRNRLLSNIICISALKDTHSV